MAHDHDHHHGVLEATPGPSEGASVVADIGGEIGAAILYVPETLADVEIEVRPVPGDWTGTHTAVRARRLADRVVWAAFLGSLPSGHYQLRVRGEPSRSADVEIGGGRVTEASWV